MPASRPSRGGRRTNHNQRGDVLARKNYSFEKRQRELAKKKKKEEKLKRKRDFGKDPGQGADAEAVKEKAPAEGE